MTEAGLERRLRFVYDCCGVKWRKPTKDTWAMVIPNSGRSEVVLPPDADDDYSLRTLFHELSHVAMPGELWAFGDFTEDILTRVIEPRLMNYLVNSPTRQRWWLRKLKVDRDRRGRAA